MESVERKTFLKGENFRSDTTSLQTLQTWYYFWAGSLTNPVLTTFILF